VSLMSRIYDPFMAPLERLGLARWRGRVAGPAGGRVLEIGAGTGLNLPYYRHAAEVTATDPDAAMLGQAWKRAAKARAPVTFVVADAQCLPFADGSFDTAVVALTFCTIPDPAAAFAEVRRVLRPGGVVRMLEHVRAPQPWAARLQDAATPAWSRLAGGCRPNRPTLETALAAGFEPLEVRHRLRGLLLIAILRRP